MDNIKISARSWVIVCDGAKALLLRNEGDALNVNLAVVETFGQENLKDSELGTDRPGRSYQSSGTARSSMEQTNWHEAAEADFLTGLVSKLSDMAFSKEIEDIVVVAPPVALGIMRPLYSTHLKAVVSAEVAKDLVKHPVKDIEKLLAG